MALKERSCSAGSCSTERKRNDASFARRRNEEEGRTSEVRYNRRRTTTARYVRDFFRELIAHRRGFFVIKMILYLETWTADNLHAG